jgi:hypothetical protein
MISASFSAIPVFLDAIRTFVNAEDQGPLLDVGGEAFLICKACCSRYWRSYQTASPVRVRMLVLRSDRWI